jgi:hypothetical protein
MKYADIQKLHEAGRITGEQRRKIIGHLRFKDPHDADVLTDTVADALGDLPPMP